MQFREVPRHIDAPNRMPEYALSALIGYYGTMFLTHNALFGFFMAFVGVYIVYRLTLGKPEGYAMRFMYRFTSFGKGIPTPARVKHFEV
ncbi:MAG: hypothetical protein COY40_04150 [Alphaproteobacteria bacterium CG_4_10_14_0_8_um_filter_53_9]|nr:MAG: hypothetical protein COY40_04150 [Alphaproteobacteria bacterium CG_4_10_14_0_8_um_filter_53_9]